MDVKKMWGFIKGQYDRCNKRMISKSYRDVIDLIYDIAGNISNLYMFIETGNITANKGKLLNNLSVMFREGVFSEDFGLILRDKWDLRNLAKYGYFASSKVDIKNIEIPEEKIKKLFEVVQKMFSEFETYLEDTYVE